MSTSSHGNISIGGRLELDRPVWTQQAAPAARPRPHGQVHHKRFIPICPALQCKLDPWRLFVARLVRQPLCNRCGRAAVRHIGVGDALARTHNLCGDVRLGAESAAGAPPGRARSTATPSRCSATLILIARLEIAPPSFRPAAVRPWPSTQRVSPMAMKFTAGLWEFPDLPPDPRTGNPRHRPSGTGPRRPV